MSSAAEHLVVTHVALARALAAARGSILARPRRSRLLCVRLRPQPSGAFVPDVVTM